MCVHSSIMRQHAGDHDRLVVHLYNDVNTTAFHGLPNEDVPLREDILPIHEIELALRADYQIDNAHLEPGGHALAVEKVDEGIRIKVPKLEIHAMVIVELRP